MRRQALRFDGAWNVGRAGGKLQRMRLAGFGRLILPTLRLCERRRRLVYSFGDGNSNCINGS